MVCYVVSTLLGVMSRSTKVLDQMSQCDSGGLARSGFSEAKKLSMSLKSKRL